MLRHVFFCNLVGKYTDPMNLVLYDLFEGWSVVGNGI